ncbi:MAG TPA: transcription antitermination factor NusB, partial [Alphaproteobacteria bacterium]|nr:transcription antitermination factor NusB [Alphaproteobacteria bacterium]
IIEQLTNRPGATFEGGGFAEIDRDLFADVARGALRRRAQIDGLLGEALSPRWPINRLELILAAVLRCGAYELLLRPDVPARVIINEYLEVAHAFFSGDEPGLVNGVLDRLARRLRPEELHDGGQQRQG